MASQEDKPQAQAGIAHISASHIRRFHSLKVTSILMAVFFDLFFGIFGLILNVGVIVALTFEKSMTSPTYQFMAQLAMADVEEVIGTFLGPTCQILAGFSRTKNVNNFWVKLFIYMNCCGSRTSVVWMMLVAFSRWVVFANQAAVENWWSKKRNQYILRFLVWGSVHLFYSPILYIPNAVLPASDDGGLYIYSNETTSHVFRIVDEPLLHGGAIVQILFNVLSLALIYKMRKQMMTPELRGNHKREVRLLIQCSLDCSIFCAFDLCYAVYLYTDSSTNWFTLPGMSITSLLNHIDCAVIYLCFNKRLRDFVVGNIRQAFLWKPAASVAPQSQHHRSLVVAHR